MYIIVLRKKKLLGFTNFPFGREVIFHVLDASLFRVVVLAYRSLPLAANVYSCLNSTSTIENTKWEMCASHVSDPGMLMVFSIRNSHDPQEMEYAITNFKQYIKRNLVDLTHVEDYCTSLILVFNDCRDLCVLAFSTLCHLIKRVSIQDPKVLSGVYNSVIPFLLERLVETKDSIRLTALKSIKTCIESAPNGEINQIIQFLVGDGMKDEYIQGPVLDLLYQITESSANFKFSFKYILDNIIHILSSDNEDVVHKVNQLLVLYFTRINPTNNTARSDLVNSLVEEKIDPNVVSILLNSIDATLFNKYLSQLDSSEPDIQAKAHLDEILDKIPMWNADDSNLKPLDFDRDSSKAAYENMLSNFQTHFEGKESERNWKQRQELIIKLREILRGGNLLQDYSIENYLYLIKEVKECICKGMLSLRTSLSNNSCQLVKDLGLFIGAYLDFSLVETFLNSLIKLTSARKIIQHQNANVAIIALLLYTSLNPKIFNMLIATSQDKNIQPRVYTGNWVQLLILKNYDPQDKELLHYIVDSLESVIIRGLSDPLPLVKDAMRNSFWTLCELEPRYESKFMRKLDPQTVKGLERAKSMYSSTIKKLIAPVKPMRPLKNLHRQNALPNLSYEPVRKLQRSESLHENRKTEPEKKQIRNHTIGSDVSKIEKLETIIGVERERERDEMEDFTGRLKRENVIYEELTSDSKSLQKSGFEKLLKESDSSSITIKFHNALNSLTITNHELFDVIFQKDSYFKKISSYISTDNVLRLFCMYYASHPDTPIEFIIDGLSIEDLCLSSIKIIDYATDTSKINNINLSIQFIKNKYRMINSILKLLEKLLTFKKDQIKSYLLASIFECLISSYSIIQADEAFKAQYIIIFELCLNEYPDLFLRALDETTDEINKVEISKELKILTNEDDGSTSMFSNDDKLLSPIKVNGEELGENLDEMTRVVPRIRHDGSVPFIQTDMTMILPKSKGHGLFDMKSDEIMGSDIFVDEGTDYENKENENPRDAMDYSKSDSFVDEKGLQQQQQQQQLIDESEIESTGTAQNDQTMHDVKGSEEEQEVPPVVDITDNDNVNQEESPYPLDEIIEEGSNISIIMKEDKVMSDSTPDINMLTIEDFGDTKIDGHLGVVLAELLEASPAEFQGLDNLETYQDFVNLFHSIERLDKVDVYNQMVVNIEKETFIVESLSLIRYNGYIEHGIIDALDKIVHIPEFVCFDEIISMFDVKTLVSFKFNKKSDRLQEMILKSILDKLEQIDCEDVFMIGTFLKRYVEHADSFIRMYSTLIFERLYHFHSNHKVDKNGVELVDELLVKDMGDHLIRYCNI